MVGPTNPSEEHFHRGLWGYDGSVWRKLHLLFGFGGIVEESLSYTNLDAGSNWLYGTYVPAGELWIIQNAMISYQGTAPTWLEILAAGLGGTITLLAVDSPAVNRGYPWGGNCILQEGDQMAGKVSGATAGDNMYLRYAGYKMKIE